MIINTDQKFTIYRDFNGLLLEDGYIWVGQENKNPIEYPVSIYFDKDLQDEATQPVRTSSGYADNYGLPANLYCSVEPYSILIQNNLGKQIFYNKSMTDLHPPISNQNLIVNGDWQLFGTYYRPNIYEDLANIYRWTIVTEAGTKSRLQFFLNTFDIGEYNNGKFYNSNSITSFPADVAADQFIKVSQFIDDIYKYNSRELTLSFRAKTSANEVGRVIAVSFDTVLYNTIDKVGISPKIFTLTENFETYYHHIKLPSYLASDGLSPYPDDYSNALIVNFWFLAGSDYGGQTNYMNEYLKAYSPKITDIKLEYGATATNFDRESISKYETLYSRTYETTFEITSNVLFTNQPGYICYISPGIQNFIPGFQFRAKKRSFDESDIKIFSYATKTEGYVTLVGTGDIEVTSINNIGCNGCGSLTLASNTAANNVYKYHYIVDDQYQL